MPDSGPGPKARVKKSAQISMSTERWKSKKRLNDWLANRRRVMLRAARKASGNATSAASKVPAKAMTMVWKSLVQTSPCCHSELFQKLSKASERLECSGSMRLPETIRPTTSPIDLPKKGDCGSKMKLAQPRKRRET